MAKIAVSSTGNNLEAQVDPRFGRCAYLILVDTESMKYEAVQNANVNAMSGAGIQTAQLVANKGVEAVLTGNVGPNAFQTLQAAGVKVIVGVTGKVKDAVQMYKEGRLQATVGPSVASHFGIGGGFGMGRGIGMSRGMGMGRGMGAGMMGQPPFAQQPPVGQPTSPADKSQELSYLKQQADYLKKQLEEITKRIEELEKRR